MSSALAASGLDMGAVGRAPDYPVKNVLIVADGRERNVTYYIDRNGHPYAYEEVGVLPPPGAVEKPAVMLRTRMVPFSEVADWMAPPDFARIDADLLRLRFDLIRQLGPLRTFLEG